MHIRQTRYSPCLALYIAQQEALPGLNEDDAVSTLTDMLNEDMDIDNKPDNNSSIERFTGDFFGIEYNAEDFPGFEDSEDDANELNDDAWEHESDSSNEPKEADSDQDGSDYDMHSGSRSSTSEFDQSEPLETFSEARSASPDSTLGCQAIENSRLHHGLETKLHMLNIRVI